MSKQTQAEPCVLYIRVSTTRQANQGVSLKAQIARGKLHAQYQNFLLPNTHIFIDSGVSAKTPLWSRPAGKQMKEFIAQAQNQADNCLQNGPIISQHHRLPCYS